MNRVIGASLCSLVLAFPLVAGAATISVESTDNATVQPAGPRSGASGKSFFNMEGSTAGGASFASFGVADFVFVSDPTATSVSNVKLQFIQSNAGFSHTGPLSFYLAAVTTSAIIQPGDPNQVKYQNPTTANGSAAVDPGLGALTLVGSGIYTVVATGAIDTFTLNDPAIAGPLLSVIQNGGTLRLIVTPDDGPTAATYAGDTNSTLAGPTLIFDSNIPEPASAMLLGLGFVGALSARRHRAAR